MRRAKRAELERQLADLTDVCVHLVALAAGALHKDAQCVTCRLARETACYPKDFGAHSYDADTAYLLYSGQARARTP